MPNNVKLVKDKKIVRLSDKNLSKSRRTLNNAMMDAFSSRFTDVIVIARTRDDVLVYSTGGRVSTHLGMLEYAKHNIYQS